MTRPRPTLDVSACWLEFPAAPVEWAEVFGNANPVELEVGPGKGLFLVNAAAAQPARNFIGIEIAKKYARMAAERVTKAELGNVRVISGDARRFVGTLVPPESLEAVHVYFPDPWWKKRHKKRRVFCEEFVGDVSRSLRPGGRLWIATDVEEYYGVMLELMSRRADFHREADPQPGEPAHELDYLTNFERKYRIEGRPIYRAGYVYAGARVEPG